MPIDSLAASLLVLGKTYLYMLDGLLVREGGEMIGAQDPPKDVCYGASHPVNSFGPRLRPARRFAPLFVQAPALWPCALPSWPPRPSDRRLVAHGALR